MDLPTHLRNGPKTAQELARLLGVTEKTLYKHVNRLVEARKVTLHPLRAGSRWTSLYSLPQHIDMAVGLSGFLPVSRLPAAQPRIHPAVETLRARLLREPDVDEIAVEVRENPEDRTVRELIYRVGYSLGWKPPTPEERERGRVRRERILKVGAWLREGRAPASLAKMAKPDEVERARGYLRRFPDAFDEGA